MKTKAIRDVEPSVSIYRTQVEHNVHTSIHVHLVHAVHHTSTDRPVLVVLWWDLD